MSETIYTGDRVPNRGGPGTVTFLDPGGCARPLPPRHEVRSHSPDGFQWGYGGSGPAQLALALCLHVLDGDVARATRTYQQFKRRVVAFLPDAWDLSRTEILTAIESIESDRTEGENDAR